MTKIEITIQDGKITFIEKKGDELPNPMWDELVCAVTNVVERNELNYDTRTCGNTKR